MKTPEEFNLEPASLEGRSVLSQILEKVPEPAKEWILSKLADRIDYVSLLDCLVEDIIDYGAYKAIGGQWDEPTYLASKFEQLYLDHLSEPSSEQLDRLSAIEKEINYWE